MKLICGLGNPGREYQHHRHNVGFMVVDALAHRARADLGSSKFDATLGQGALGGHKVLLLKPQTFMNHSGRSLAQAARFYKVAPEDVLVIHDELDLPYGRLQLKSGGGAGGHNGLRSILDCLGEDRFGRLRVGVGKPEGGKERVVGHVLAPFSSEEQAQLGELLDRASEAAAGWAELGMAQAMNRYNRR
jgi:peptidyl-tRNA hydrolase, PTH1 family